MSRLFLLLLLLLEASFAINKDGNLCFYNYISKRQLCTEHLNMTRFEMPQLGDAFLDFLSTHPHIASWCEWTDPSQHTSTQCEIHDSLVLHLMQSISEKGQLSPVLVSTDGHVLDGHHRWAALEALKRPVKTVVIDLPIRSLLRLAMPFSESREL